MAELENGLVVGVKLQVELSYPQGFFVLMVPDKQEKLNKPAYLLNG